MRAGLFCHRGDATAGTFRERQRSVATDVFMAKHDDKIVFLAQAVTFSSFPYDFYYIIIIL